jgi:O-acetylhomoserine (thiol)-lyase
MEAEQKTVGVSPDFVRLSIGLLDIEEILWDFDQALRS